MSSTKRTSHHSKRNSHNENTQQNNVLPINPNVVSTNKPTSTLNDFEILFRNLQHEIYEYNKVIESVQSFKAHIEQGLRDGVFDNQDIQWVEEDLKTLMEDKEKKEVEYNKRKEIYENSVLKLENILEKRKQIIEDADKNTHIFSNRKDLLKKFAHKSATLLKLIEQGKKDLQQPFK
jgi:hypothetical protein